MNLDVFNGAGYRAIVKSHKKNEAAYNSKSFFESEGDLISFLEKGNTVRVLTPLDNAKEGILCLNGGRVMLEIPPKQNGRSPLYLFALKGSLIQFKDLVFL